MLVKSAFPKLAKFNLGKMHLYDCGLERTRAQISHSIIGNFSDTKHQELLCVRSGMHLELMRIDASSGALSTVLVSPAFGLVQAIAPLRLVGSSKGNFIDVSIRISLINI